MPMSISTINSPADDPLNSGPPSPTARSAPRSGKSGGMPPRLSSTQGVVGGAAHLLGAGGTIARPMELMMTLENTIRELMQFRPDIGALFSAPIGQARGMLAAGMADIAQGGTGLPAQDAGVPPPQQGGGAPAGPGGPMLPPPPGMPG
jgi:hypothetical protein